MNVMIKITYIVSDCVNYSIRYNLLEQTIQRANIGYPNFSVFFFLFFLLLFLVVDADTNRRALAVRMIPQQILIRAIREITSYRRQILYYNTVHTTHAHTSALGHTLLLKRTRYTYMHNVCIHVCTS